jgi:hypothetical protein
MILPINIHSLAVIVHKWQPRIEGVEDFELNYMIKDKHINLIKINYQYFF